MCSESSTLFLSKFQLLSPKKKQRKKEEAKVWVLGVFIPVDIFKTDVVFIVACVLPLFYSKEEKKPARSANTNPAPRKHKRGHLDHK